MVPTLFFFFSLNFHLDFAFFGFYKKFFYPQRVHHFVYWRQAIFNFFWPWCQKRLSGLRQIGHECSAKRKPNYWVYNGSLSFFLARNLSLRKKCHFSFNCIDSYSQKLQVFLPLSYFWMRLLCTHVLVFLHFTVLLFSF